MCGLVAAVALCAAAMGQVAGQGARVGVRAEFRTAARRMVTGAVDRGRMVPTRGAVSSAVAQLQARGQAQDMGRRDPAAAMEDIQLVLVRPQERQAAFDAQVEALHRRGDVSYHQWLTPTVVGTEFGPAAEDVAALTGYLRGEGFTVNAVGLSGMYVDFSGTVGQVEQSFHTEIDTVRTADGEEHYAAVKEAEIPAALSGLVAGFVSLSDVRTVHPNYRRAVPVGMRAGAFVNPPIAKDAMSGASGVMDGATEIAGNPRPLDDVSSSNYAVAPGDFYTIYNETPLLNPVLPATTRIDGTGVTIALLEQSAIAASDVTQFRTMFGVSPATPASLVTDTGFGTNRCTAPGKLKSSGDEGEAVLDIEWAGAVAPGANLIFMQCASTRTTGGVFLSAEAAIDNNLADILSLSYGEYEGGSSGEDTLANDLWEQAASQGQTVVVSAGDAGTATEDDGKTYATHGITVSTLSSTAWNVSAGGTDFMDVYNQAEGDGGYGLSAFWSGTNSSTYSSALGYVPEMTWNDTCASSIYNAQQKGMTADGAALCGATAANGGSSLYLVAGGGGPSILTSRPRPSWQTGTVFGLPTLATQPNRLQPDVSLFAANGFWGHDLPSYESDETTPLSYAGGTSFVAPQLAGVFALIVQKWGERLGQPNYVLYNMAGQAFGVNSFTGSGCNGSGASGVGTTGSLPGSGCVFYDVQAGNISVDCQAGTTDCYTLSGASFGILSTSTTAELPAFATNAGWDMATGIGSINITNLVNNWQTAAAGGTLFAPTVAVTGTTASYTYGLPTAIPYTATVSGSGSYPTGSVTFAGSGAIATMGNDALVAGAGCSAGTACTETATQVYTAAGTLAAGSYTITANYLSTNENYATGVGTTALTVNRQTPVVSVSAASAGAGTPVNLAATIAYAGTGIAPTGGMMFQVDSGAVVAATCTGTASPLSCAYSGYSTTGLVVGPHTITAVALGDTNYASATGTAALTVMTAPTMVFAVANRHTQDAAFAVSATSNSAGAISYSVVSGPATIVGSTVTLTGVGGTVVLQASQAAGGSFGTGLQTASFAVIAGSVWFGDGTGAVSSFDWTGAAINSYAGGGVGTIASGLGMAFDASGNVWVASTNGVSELTRQGAAVTGTAVTVGGVSKPLAIAVDGLGQVWVANTAGTVSVLTNAGAALSPATGYNGPGTKPAGIAVDSTGSVWVPSSTANTVTRILGVAAPVAPLAANTPGVEP
jgi:subtilase family serine protease